mmetsp:Transcript_39755/g.93117  ORF Transcript_39755/g.93117 Transcript_39755/m.93117 type:complete len:83 (+) Transcript_39755:1518-1766(+)
MPPPSSSPGPTPYPPKGGRLQCPPPPSSLEVADHCFTSIRVAGCFLSPSSPLIVFFWGVVVSITCRLVTSTDDRQDCLLPPR